MVFGGTEPIRPAICDPDQNGRILNSDHSGRSFRVLLFRRPEGVRQVRVLTDLRIGETATLVSLDLPDSVQNFLMHMGFVPEAQVTALRHAPAGDPTVYGIDGMEIALRRETAEAIRVRPSSEIEAEPTAGPRKIDTEIERIAIENEQNRNEVHEFAGAIR